MQTVFLHQTIDDHFNVVAVVFVEFDIIRQFADFPVHPHPHEAFRRKAGDQFFVSALFAAHHGGEDLEPRAIR